MDSDYARVQQLAEKLVHPMYDVRDRAIKNIISKIEHNIINVHADYNSSLEVILNNVKESLTKFSNTDAETDNNGENLSYMLTLCRLIILLGNASMSNKHVASKLFAKILDSLYAVLNASSLDAGLAERVQQAIDSILVLNGAANPDLDFDGDKDSGNRYSTSNFGFGSGSSSSDIYSAASATPLQRHYPPVVSTTNTAISTPASGAGLVLQSPLCFPADNSSQSIYGKPSPLSQSDSRSLFDLEVKLSMDINTSATSKSSSSVIDQLYRLTLDFPINQILSRSNIIAQVMNIVGAIHLSDHGTNPSNVNTNHPDKNVVVSLVNWLKLVMERAILLFDDHFDGTLCTYLPERIVDSENLGNNNSNRADKNPFYAGSDNSDLSATKMLTHSMYLLRDPIANCSSNSNSNSVNYVDMYKHASDIIAAKYGSLPSNKTDISLSGFAFACVAVTLPLMLSANINNYGEVLKLVDLCLPFVSEPTCCPGDIQPAQHGQILSTVDLGRYQHILNRFEQIVIFINNSNSNRLASPNAGDGTTQGGGPMKSIIETVVNLFKQRGADNAYAYASSASEISDVSDSCWQFATVSLLIKTILAVPSCYYQRSSPEKTENSKLQIGAETLCLLQKFVIFKKPMICINSVESTDGQEPSDNLISPLLEYLLRMDPDFVGKVNKLETLYYQMKIIKELSIGGTENVDMVVDAVFGSAEILMNPLFDESADDSASNASDHASDYTSLMDGLSALVATNVVRLFFGCDAMDRSDNGRLLAGATADLLYRVLLSSNNKKIRQLVVAEMTDLLRKMLSRSSDSSPSGYKLTTVFDQYVTQTMLRSEKDSIVNRIISLKLFKVIGYIIISESQDFDEAVSDITTSTSIANIKPIHLLNLLCEIVNSTSTFNEARDIYPLLFPPGGVSNHTINNNESDLLVVLKLIEWKFKFPSSEGCNVNNVIIGDAFTPKSLFALSEKIETYYSEYNKSVYSRVLILGLFYSHMTLRNTSVLKLLYELGDNNERSRLMSPRSKANRDFIADITTTPLFTIFANVSLNPSDNNSNNGNSGGTKKSYSSASYMVRASNLFTHADVRKMVKIIVNSNDTTVQSNAMSQLLVFLSDANILKTCEMPLILFTINAIIQVISKIHSEYLISTSTFNDEEKEAIINGLKVVQHIAFSLKSINNFVVFDNSVSSERTDAKSTSDRFINICPLLSLLFSNNSANSKSVPSLNSIALQILFSFAVHFDSFFDSVLADNVGSVHAISLRCSKTDVVQQQQQQHHHQAATTSSDPNSGYIGLVVSNVFVNDFVLPLSSNSSDSSSSASLLTSKKKDPTCGFFDYSFTSPEFNVCSSTDLESLKSVAQANDDISINKSQYTRRLLRLFSSPLNCNHNTNNTILMLHLTVMNYWQSYGNTLLCICQAEKRHLESQNSEDESLSASSKAAKKGQSKPSRKAAKLTMLPAIVTNIFVVTPNNESDFITMYNTLRYIDALFRHLISFCSNDNYEILVEFLNEMRIFLLSTKMVDFFCGYSYSTHVSDRDTTSTIFKHCCSMYMQLLSSYIDLWRNVKLFLDSCNGAQDHLQVQMDAFTSSSLGLSNPVHSRLVSKCVEVLVIEDENHGIRMKSLSLLTALCKFDSASLNTVLFNKLSAVSSSEFSKAALDSDASAPCHFNHLMNTLLLLRSPDSFRDTAIVQQLLLLLTLSLNSAYATLSSNDENGISDTIRRAFASMELNRFTKFLFERKSQIKVAAVKLMLPVMNILTIVSKLDFDAINSYCKMYGSHTDSGANYSAESAAPVSLGEDGDRFDRFDNSPRDLAPCRALTNMVTSLMYLAEDPYESVSVRINCMAVVHSVHRLLVCRNSYAVAEGILTFSTLTSGHFHAQKRIAILSDLINVEACNATNKAMTWTSIHMCVQMLYDMVDLALSIQTNREVLLDMIRESFSSVKVLPKLIKLLSESIIPLLHEKRIANVFGDIDNNIISSSNYSADLKQGNFVVNVSNFNAFKDGDLSANQHILSWSVLSRNPVNISGVSFLSGASTTKDTHRYGTYLLTAKLIQKVDALNGNANFEVLRTCFDRTQIYDFLVNILHELQISEKCDNELEQRDVGALAENYYGVSHTDLGRLRRTKASLMLGILQIINCYIKSYLNNILDPNDKIVAESIADKSSYMGRVALSVMTSIDVSVDKSGIETLSFATLFSFSEFLFIIFNNRCILNALEDDNEIFRSALFTKIPSFIISWILNIERGLNIKVDKVDAELVSNVKNRLVLLLAVICRNNPDVARQLIKDNVVTYPIDTLTSFCEMLASNKNNGANSANSANSSSAILDTSASSSSAMNSNSSGSSNRAALSAKSKLAHVNKASGNGTNNGLKGAFIAKPVESNKWRNQARSYALKKDPNISSSSASSPVNISMKSSKDGFLDPLSDFKPSKVFISLLLLQNSMLQSREIQDFVAERLDKGKLLLLLQTAQQSSLAISTTSHLSSAAHKEVVALIWGFLFAFINGNKNNQKILLLSKESVVRPLLSETVGCSDDISNSNSNSNSAVFHLLLNNGLSTRFPTAVRLAQLFLLRTCISSGSSYLPMMINRALPSKVSDENFMLTMSDIESLGRKKIVYAKIVIKLIEKIVKEATSNVSDNYQTSSSSAKNDHFSSVSMCQIAILLDILTGCICPESVEPSSITGGDNHLESESAATLFAAFVLRNNSNTSSSNLSELTNHELNGLFGELSELIKWLTNTFVISASNSNNYLDNISSYSLISMALLRFHGRIAYTFAVADEETRLQRKLGGGSNSKTPSQGAFGNNTNMISSSRGRYLALLSSDSTIMTIIKNLVPDNRHNAEARHGDFTLAFTSLVTLLVIVYNSESAKANFKLMIKDYYCSLAPDGDVVAGSISGYAFTNPTYYQDMNESLFEKYKSIIVVACNTLGAALSEKTC